MLFHPRKRSSPPALSLVLSSFQILFVILLKMHVYAHTNTAAHVTSIATRKVSRSGTWISNDLRLAARIRASSSVFTVVALIFFNYRVFGSHLLLCGFVRLPAGLLVMMRKWLVLQLWHSSTSSAQSHCVIEMLTCINYRNHPGANVFHRYLMYDSQNQQSMCEQVFCKEMRSCLNDRVSRWVETRLLSTSHAEWGALWGACIMLFAVVTGSPVIIGHCSSMSAAASSFSFCRPAVEYRALPEDFKHQLSRRTGGNLTWHDGRGWKTAGGRTVKLLQQPGTEALQVLNTHHPDSLHSLRSRRCFLVLVFVLLVISCFSLSLIGQSLCLCLGMWIEIEEGRIDWITVINLHCRNISNQTLSFSIGCTCNVKK